MLLKALQQMHYLIELNLILYKSPSLPSFYLFSVFFLIFLINLKSFLFALFILLVLVEWRHRVFFQSKNLKS